MKAQSVPETVSTRQDTLPRTPEQLLKHRKTQADRFGMLLGALPLVLLYRLGFGLILPIVAAIIFWFAGKSLWMWGARATKNL